MTASRQTHTAGAILKIGWRRKWQIVLPAIAIAAVASWWVHRLPDRYRSEALLMAVPQRAPEAFVRSTVTTRAEQRLQSMTQKVLSRTELERIIREFDLYAEHRKTGSMQDVVDQMRRDVEIRPVKGDAFRLGFSADHPDMAMRVVERLVALFVVESSLDRASLAERADQFLQTQLEDARRKLIDNESRLAEYRHRHNGELPDQLEANVRGLHNTELQIQVLSDSLNRDRERQLMLERALKDARLTELIESRGRKASDDVSKLTTSGQLEKAEAMLKDMKSTLRDQHPDVVAVRQKIAELRLQATDEDARRTESGGAGAAEALRDGRREELLSELSALEKRIVQKTVEGERLRGVLANYLRRIEAGPTREAELAALTRDYDTLQQTYRALLTKKQESEVAANLERQPIGEQFRVLDPARLPEEPSAPKRARLYALAAIGGLGVGLLLAVILEWSDRGLRTQEDVRAALGLPVLAAIPLVSARPRIAHRATLSAVVTGLLMCMAVLAWRFLK